MLTSANAQPCICLNVSNMEPLYSPNKLRDPEREIRLAFGILKTLPFRKLFLLTARLSSVNATS